MPVTASSQEKTEEEPSSEVRFRERERSERSERSERYSRRGRRTQRGEAPMLQSSLGWALRQGVWRRDR